MDKPKATPKDFFLWAGAMLSLYGGVIAFIALIFDYINYAFPDTTLNYYTDPYQGGVAYEMASLIVLAPLFLLLMRIIRRSIAADASRGEVWVRRWALFLVLFLAGASVAVDLIVLITTFLQGEELTTRFLLKVLVVLLVASAGFMHFMADLWGYWQKKPQYARSVNYSVGVLILLTVAAGFLILGSPQSQRALRIDAQRVNDLQSLQSQILSFYQQKERLPLNLAELNDPLSYYTIPKDPKTGQDYGYRPDQAVSGMKPTFEVCATFDTASAGTDPSYAEPMGRSVGMDQKWIHGVGQTCFERVIDPELYPPLNPKTKTL